MASKRKSLGLNVLLLGILVVALMSISLTLSLVKSQEPEAEAAKGGKAPASIVLNQTDPHLGDTVTFTASGGNSITLNCFQGGLGNLVYAARQDVGTGFVLGGGDSQWQSGEASCVVYLYSRNRYQAQTSFYALGAR